MRDRVKRYIIFLVSAVIILTADMLGWDRMFSFYVMTIDVLPSVVAMWWLSSSFSETKLTKWVVLTASLFNMALLAFHICRIAGIADMMTDSLAVSVSSMTAAMTIGLMIYGMAGMVGDVKSIMKNGSVWAVVCLVVDVIYMLFIIISVALVQLHLSLFGLVLISGAAAAIGIRELTSQKFVVRRELERIIVESMKVASVPSAADGANIDDVYKELYERIVAYFDRMKPYLDNDLTINSVVKDLYTNKLYVSKAISLFTGRNFCQFVNYHRVSHSMECFRDNPELKVHELANLSGFNSVVSYNMAFRLFMGETPGEWCRKEKRALMKKK